MPVPVRRYTRRSPAPQRSLPTRRRPPSTPGSLGAIIDDVVTGKRSGYTWTGNWRFDVDDPISMKRVYDKLGPEREMYIIAETNIKLEDRLSGKLPGRGLKNITIHGPHGVGLWRADDGTVYMDDVHVWVDFSLSFALAYARKVNQKYILRVDGRTRSYEFVEVSP